MRKRMLILLAALAILATPAAAEKGQKSDWELGAYGGIGFPDDYDIANPQDGWLYGARFGYFFSDHWSLEGSIQDFNSRTDFDPSLGVGNVDIGLRSYRLNVLYNFLPGHSFRWFLTAGLGREFTDSPFVNSHNIGRNLGAGARWYFGKYFGIRLDGRVVSIPYDKSQLDERQANMELAAGVLWSFGGAASAPAADSDGDGVSDRKDKCPDTPAGARVDERGCPIDTDGDGVPDGIDACPDSPRGSKVDAKGCPPDSDQDGVTDDKDACPGTPRGAPVDDKGCPRDSDGDGVFDHLDRCPDTPPDAKVDSSGCPIPEAPPAPPEPPKMFNAVLEGVNFATNSSRLTADSMQILDKVADTLKEWPDVKVEIGGHTDSQGNDASNLKLSGARAESVRKYLVSKGVDGSRLTAKGYGETVPIADNGTAAGRAQNRRVELKTIP
ncbi:MAG TPA: OmpA family protein [Candidatus Polarisedimenticolia bacterium]|nr:OmpA family protein [Candidatus Polarisedimenticolia bacterium]